MIERTMLWLILPAWMLGLTVSIADFRTVIREQTRTIVELVQIERDRLYFRAAKERPGPYVDKE
jgi:hypothetical protein